MKELIFAIDSLKTGKSADNKGIKAEDLKGADEETTKMIHEVFNFIIKQDSSMTSSSWTKEMVTVIYKKRELDKNQKITDQPVPSECFTNFSPR